MKNPPRSDLSILVLAFISLHTAAAHGTSKSPNINSEFWKFWGDGQAEVAGYQLELNRYGEKRVGQAVTIFVTETFGHEHHVKVDRPTPGPQYPVMKLNLIRDFQTGIYDYNTMLSAFVSLEQSAGIARGAPTKISFGSQEWCGQVYHQLLFEPGRAHETIHSYFDTEGDQERSIEVPGDALSEDILWHWARKLASPVLNPGESMTLPLLPSLYGARLNHRKLALGRVTVSRASQTTSIEVDAGRFEVERVRAFIEGGARWEFEVEVAPPHRIIRWHNDRGEKATLRGAERMAYWKLNGPDGAKRLKALGIAPLP